MDKLEVMSNEFIEINNIIALAKADSDIQQMLLGEIVREFEGELNTKKEQVFYQDQIAEIIELAKHDMDKMITLFTMILEDEDINAELFRHFQELINSDKY